MSFSIRFFFYTVWQFAMFFCVIVPPPTLPKSPKVVSRGWLRETVGQGFRPEASGHLNI